MITLMSLAFYAFRIMANPAPDSLTLDDCQRMARQNFPNLENKRRYEKLFQLTRKEINTIWLPQATLNGQFAYQSDVFELPFAPQGIELVEIPHERYMGTVDISQTIYDGGMSRNKKTVEQERLKANQKDLDGELLELERTVNDLYFAILLAQKNDSILQQTQALLREREKAVQAAYEGGTAAVVDVLRIQTELLNIERQAVENRKNLRALTQTLEIAAGMDLDNAAFHVPDLPQLPVAALDNRPEIGAVEARMRELEAQSQGLASELKPRVSAFFSGGAGAPNPYNFYEVDFSGFYNAGVRLSWKFIDWKAASYDRQALQIRKDMLNAARENIERNIETKLVNIREDYEMHRNLAERDREIIAVREKIRDLSALRLDEGVISSTEFLEDVNAEKTAKLAYEARRIQMLKTAYDYILESGHQRDDNL